ncbi:hypothetical protein [Pseudomonas putida]|uniref:hypothetical protein n=1 Tax=Pseudomonas putida TaxID=303 RepID=UPI0012DABE7D|nr:hypothetical protein [Pseudomonas putida]
MVIDTNYLDNPLLADYLSKQSDNFIAITDYTAMEMYKSSNIEGLHKRLKIVENYLPQVLVMKNTYHVCADNGRCSGLKRRLIDMKQTKAFPGFVDAVQEGVRGDLRKRLSYSEHVSAAEVEMRKMLAGSENVISGMVELYRTMSRSELGQLRSEAPLSLAFSEKILNHIINLTLDFYASHPNVRKLPKPENLPHTFLFRVALTVHCYMLDRFKHGVSQSISAENVRNDMIDIYVVAYSTLFDGVLTTDKRAKRVSSLTRQWLARYNA